MAQWPNLATRPFTKSHPGGAKFTKSVHGDNFSTVCCKLMMLLRWLINRMNGGRNAKPYHHEYSM